MTRHAPLRAAVVTAVVIAAFLTWLCARRITIVNDEGIYLDGALRILHGQVPYRDFFIVMGPGTFWLEALAFKVFGISLAAARVVLIADLSVIAACVCWLVVRHTQPAYAIWITVVTIFFVISDPGVALPNHRWDSAAFAIVAATLVVARGRPTLTFVAGLCAGFAAWITPSVALVGIALLGWMLLAERDRVVAFVSGIAAVSAICAAVLASEHALVPMLQQMLWTQRNYTTANLMPYGSRIGGYASLFAGSTAAEFPVHVLTVLAITIPAILPPIILPFCLTRTARQNREILILAIAAVVLLITAYPRMDVPHLTYATPLVCALGGFFAYRMPWKIAKPVAFLCACIFATLPVGYEIFERVNMVRLETRVGEVVASEDDTALIRGLEREIGRGDSLFCFPYQPIFYFLTLGENPTRFSYLQPGMMSDDDEMAALSELQARPPGTITYQDVPPDRILRIWPHSDPRRLRLQRIETFLKCRYHVGSLVPYRGAVVEILRLNPPLPAGAVQCGRTAVSSLNEPRP